MADCCRFVLECRGDGDPDPVYSWYRDGEQLTREQLDQLGLQLVEDTDHSQLEFSSPELRHQGRYHCEASNDLGEQSNLGFREERIRSFGTIFEYVYTSHHP